MALITCRCHSKSPWEKLRRATFMPASIIFASIPGDSDAGPIVQTIFVFCRGSSFIVTSPFLP